MSLSLQWRVDAFQTESPGCVNIATQLGDANMSFSECPVFHGVGRKPAARLAERRVCGTAASRNAASTALPLYSIVRYIRLDANFASLKALIYVYAFAVHCGMYSVCDRALSKRKQHAGRLPRPGHIA
jgi:hypothetical protein